MVNRVLAELSFSEAAQNVSTRMRAHRLKPAEKAAGAGTCSYLSRHAMVRALCTPPHMHASSCCSTPTRQRCDIVTSPPKRQA